jgi:hypothetical protein
MHRVVKTSSKLTNMRRPNEHIFEVYIMEKQHWESRINNNNSEKRKTNNCIEYCIYILKILKVHHLWRKESHWASRQYTQKFSKLNLISLSFIFVRFSIHKMLLLSVLLFSTHTKVKTENFCRHISLQLSILVNENEILNCELERGRRNFFLMTRHWKFIDYTRRMQKTAKCWFSCFWSAHGQDRAWVNLCEFQFSIFFVNCIIFHRVTSHIFYI